MSKQERGSSLLELMVVVLIITIMAVMTLPRLHEHMAAREIDIIASRFITHAHFARSQAFTLGIPVRIAPLTGNLWDEGWVIKSACTDRPLRSDSR